MNVSNCVQCKDFPCRDVDHQRYILPDVELDPGRITHVLISEAAPAELSDYYYAGGSPLFQQTTLQAFQDAGYHLASIQELLELGVYLTSAVKCGKTAYAIQADTIRECSRLLEQELELFPNARAYLLMGDVAIKALNLIAKRAGEPRPIPAGSTYKIRDREYFFRKIRVFPSYLQAGPSFFIEKSKRKMIAEDIARAMSLPEQPETPFYEHGQ